MRVRALMAGTLFTIGLIFPSNLFAGEANYDQRAEDLQKKIKLLGAEDALKNGELDKPTNKVNIKKLTADIQIQMSACKELMGENEKRLASKSVGDISITHEVIIRGLNKAIDYAKLRKVPQNPPPPPPSHEEPEPIENEPGDPVEVIEETPTGADDPYETVGAIVNTLDKLREKNPNRWGHLPNHIKIASSAQSKAPKRIGKYEGVFKRVINAK